MVAHFTGFIDNIKCIYGVGYFHWLGLSHVRIKTAIMATFTRDTRW